MKRAGAILFLAPLLMGLFNGCQSPTSLRPSLPSFASLRGEKTPRQEEPPVDNPFGSSEETSAADRKASAARSAKAARSEELSAQIDKELPDLTAEEKADLLKELSDVEPSMANQIVRMRRMVRRMGQKSQVAKAAQVADDGDSFGHSGGLHSPLPGDQLNSAKSTGLPAGKLQNEFREIDPARPLASATSPRNEHGEILSVHAQSQMDQPSAVNSADYNTAASPVLSFGNAETQNGLQAGRPTNGSTGDAALPPVQTNTLPIGSSPGQPAQSQSPAAQLAAWAGLPFPGQQQSSPPATSAEQPPPSQAGSVAERFNVTGLIPSLGPLAKSAEEPVAAPLTKEQQLDQLISLAEAELANTSLGTTSAEQQLYIKRHVALRMLYLVANRQERALQAIPGIEPSDQEFWQQTFWAMSNYFDSESIPHPADRATQTVAQLRTAINRLQPNANLELRNVAFCHKITSFGNYERFGRDEFNPGQRVLVYAEVENFRSEPTNDSQYRTILKSTIEILKPGDQGGTIERIPFSATEDLCRNPRRDYFHSYEFTVPQRIALGPHVLKLTVEDQLNQKVATYTLNFTVK